MRLLLPQSEPVNPSILRLVEPGDGNRLVAMFQPLNPLHGETLTPVVRGVPIIVWSGTPAAVLDEPDPRTWTGQALNDFRRWCEAAAARPDCPDQVSFRLHARHVLSDVPGARRFLQDRKAPFGITLSPATMLEPSMLDRLPEHLERMFKGLGDRADFVWISDVKVDATREWFTPVPLGEGLMPSTVLRSLIVAHVPQTTPIIVDAPRETAARAWLAI